MYALDASIFVYGLDRCKQFLIDHSQELIDGGIEALKEQVHKYGHHDIMRPAAGKFLGPRAAVAPPPLEGGAYIEPQAMKMPKIIRSRSKSGRISTGRKARRHGD